MLERAGYGVERDGDDVLVEGHDHPEEISRLLAGEQLYVSRALRRCRPDLETVFLQLTRDRPAEGSG